MISLTTLLLGIVWLIGLVLSILAIYDVFVWAAMTRMFPEGKRWWHFPTQVAALAVFASLIHWHPF